MQVFQLFVLLADNLLVLELKELTFLFKVSNDLAKTLLEKIDLSFEKLDFLILFKLPLSMFLHGLAFLLKLSLCLIIVKFQLGVLVVEVGQLLILQLGLFTQAEVLNHDVALNLRDVLLSLFNRILSEVVQQLGVVGIDLLFLALPVLSSLFLHLVVQGEQHLVTVFFVLNLLLSNHLRVFELKELVPLLEHVFHFVGLRVDLILRLLRHFDFLGVESTSIEQQTIVELFEKQVREKENLLTCL